MKRIIAILIALSHWMGFTESSWQWHWTYRRP